ncbi:MAG: phosphoglycerate kinase [Phycisphaerae bacterium]|nr:phosphoglycerate kinase [Phycisphaerae bacterium]
MEKKTIRDIDVAGKRVLVRVDLNVPQDEKTGAISDDTRIKAVVPTVIYLVDRKARVILCSHLGRPKGKPVDVFRLAPVAKRMSEILGKPIATTRDCIGPDVEQAAAALKDGDILMLENLRFHDEEEKNDAGFSQALARLADIYVNDAFGTAHRDHSSMVGVPELLGKDKVAAGFLLKKEVEYLRDKLASPAKPFLCIMGGAKVSDKIQLITNLLPKIDTLLIGGAMSYTFMKANGKGIGGSKVEADKLDLAKDIQAKAAAAGVRFELPVDFVCGKEFAANTETRVVDGEIPDGWQGFDIGPKTRAKYAQILAGARTIVWNGPVGVFEFPAFAAGTNELAEAVADVTGKGAISIIGGGDSASAIEQAGLDAKMTHISTGGGASLEMLEGKKFRSLAVLG